MDSRIQNLRKLLKEQALDAALITSYPNILYLTKYSGFVPEEREAYLFITPTEAYIFTNALYAEEIKQQVPSLTFIEISRDNSLMKILPKLFKKHSVERLGIEDDNLTAKEYKNLLVLSTIMEPMNLSKLRWIKTADEIAAIKKACEIGDKAFQHIFKKMKIGISEKELAQQLELFMKQQGADPSFRTIVAFGANAAIPHHVSDKTTLEKDSCVLMDFGVKVDNYCSDMTRTFFFGKASEQQKKVYETVRIAQQKTIDYLSRKLTKNEPVTGQEIDHIAREYIIEQGFESFPHRLGHGIGLEVHEAPSIYPLSKELLQNGMVFSIEPGIYLLGDMGVRIEDLFTIHNGKLVQLTNAPREFIEV